MALPRICLRLGGLCFVAQVFVCGVWAQQPQPTAPAATPPPIIPAQPVTPSETSELPAKPREPLPEPQLDAPLFPEYLPGERPLPGRRPPPKRRAIPALEKREDAEEPAEEEETQPRSPEVVPELDPAERVTQRTAMSQAFSTGEAILGDFTGVRGQLGSPFLPTGRKGVPAFRIGPVDLYPSLTIGVSAIQSKGGGSNSVDIGNRLRMNESPDGTPVDPGLNVAEPATDGDAVEGDQEEVEAFFQAGFRAVLREQGHFQASLDYNVGLAPQSVGQGSGSGSQSGDRTLDQSLSLGGTFLLPPIPRVEFNFGFNFATLSGTNRDVGGNAERTLMTLSLGAAYEYTRKTSFDLGFSVPLRQFTGGVSSSGPTLTLGVSNQVTKKTQLGLELSAGILTTEVLEDPETTTNQEDESTPASEPVDEEQPSGENANLVDQPLQMGQEGMTQVFQRLMLHVTTTPTKVLSLDGTGGVEIREAEGKISIGPTFGLGASWKPGYATRVTLAAESRVFNSATALDTNFTSTAINLTISQRIGYRLTAALTVGYEHAVYESVGGEDDGSSNPRSSEQESDGGDNNPALAAQGGQGGQNGRVDDLYRISLDLSLPITQRWNCGLTLSAYKNESDFQAFESYQAILQTSYAF
jgi:hypothetical protein